MELLFQLKRADITRRILRARHGALVFIDFARPRVRGVTVGRDGVGHRRAAVVRELLEVQVIVPGDPT